MIFYAKISPLLGSLRRMGGRLLRYVQGLEVYRNLVKKLIKGQVIYQWESYEGSENYLLAKKNGRVIGRLAISNFIESDSLYRGWWIFGMWVNWRCRGLGIGKRLTEMACVFAVEQSASEIKLMVFKDNQPAVNLYQKMGFRQVSIPEIDEELKEEAKQTQRQRIIMAKDIQCR